MMICAVSAAVHLGVRYASAHEPSRKWYSIKTPHFWIHYYISQRHNEWRVAQKVALEAERAHEILVPLFRHEPRQRTHIVVTDDTDDSNGSATIVPYNAIRVFVTAPSSLSTLNDYDDWLRLLVLHEYVHILHIDTIHGLPKLINAIFGKVWAPNQIQPRWFIEGLAVHLESKMTAGGRNRSTIHDMFLRVAMLSGKFLEIDQMSSTTRRFPRGTVPYLYGGRFIQFIANKYGDESLVRISHAYGGGIVPYGLNRSIKRVTNKTYVQLYREFKDSLRNRYKRQKDRVEKRGIRRGKRVSDLGWGFQASRMSIDGRELVYIADNGLSHPTMRILNARSGKLIEDYYHLGGQAASFSADRTYLVYGQFVGWRTFHGFHDLFVRSRKSGQTRRLTYGLRAREPACSPDGRWVAFVANDLGETRLGLVPFRGGKPRWLVFGKDGEQIYTPRWSSDGQTLIYSIWRKGSYRDIATLRMKDRKITYITSDRANDIEPQFSPDGTSIYFSSDRSGIYNIYRYHLANRTMKQVTNVIGGAFSPALSVSQKQLYYVLFAQNRYALYRMSLDEQRLLEPLPHRDERPKQSLADRTLPVFETKLERYNPLRTVYPRSWSLNIGSDPFGTSMGVEVDGLDVIGRHGYVLRTQFSLNEGYFTYAAAYSYARYWPTFRIDTNRTLFPRRGYFINGQERAFLEEGYSVGAALDLPVLRMAEHQVNIRVGYRFNYYRALDAPDVLVQPGHQSPVLPNLGNLAGATLSIAYGNIERYQESVSAERGRSISFALRYDNRFLASDYQNTQLTWSWIEFIKVPWVDLHVLALRYAGGLSRGDFRRHGFFGIGGFPRQDLIRAIVDQSPFGGSFLRGYRPGAFFGDQFHLLNAEYRFPLLDVERGISTLPVFFNFIHMAIFSDVGNAFVGPFRARELKVGVGGEVILEGQIGYFVPISIKLGYARGVMNEGINQIMFAWAGRF